MLCRTNVKVRQEAVGLWKVRCVEWYNGWCNDMARKEDAGALSNNAMPVDGGADRDAAQMAR